MNDEKERQIDIRDLDISPLFVEPDPSGPMSKLLPWISLIVSCVTLLAVVLQIVFAKK